MRFELQKPCKNCPFNKVGAIELMPGRVEGIQEGLLSNDWETFACHKTLSGEEVEDDEGETHYRRGTKDQHCAGAMIWPLKRDWPSVPMRIMSATDKLDFDKLLAQSDKIVD